MGSVKNVSKLLLAQTGFSSWIVRSRLKLGDCFLHSANIFKKAYQECYSLGLGLDWLVPESQKQKRRTLQLAIGTFEATSLGGGGKHSRSMVQKAPPRQTRGKWQYKYPMLPTGAIC